MTTEEALALWSLTPSLESLPAIRRELDAEINRRRNNNSTEDLLLLLCVQLFAAAQVEDSLSVWRAKRSDFDAGIYISVELLCGAGVEATRQFLRGQTSSEALTALECMECIDWTDFNPQNFLEDHYRYFLGEGT